MINRVTVLITTAMLLLAGGASLAMSRHGQVGDPPLALSLEDVQFRIVGATFVSSLQGVNARFEESQMDKYRGLILTVEVKKTPEVELTLIAQDLTLHYRYGKSSDASRCSGLSTFSTQEDVDRAMSLYSNGWGRSATGLSTTKAGTVYVDMFFQGMEPDTSELHLLLAQPVGASFEAKGWE